MEGKGFIKIYRKFIKWEWYSNKITKEVFIHLLLKANWKAGKFEGYDIPRGSLVTSRAKLAKELLTSEQQIRTALKHLKSTGEITIKATNKFTIITIVNYEMYQQNNQEENHQPTNNQPTTNHNRRRGRKERSVCGKNNRVVFPTLTDIISYSEYLGISDKGYCEKFYNHYESIGWVDKNGNKIKNWKLKFKYWIEEDKKNKKKENDDKVYFN